MQYILVFIRYDEMGLFDVPANMDMILRTTQKKKLIYIGHSMGTTMFFVAMASRPDLNAKIDVMIGLAPVASLAHLSSPLKVLAPYVKPIQVSSNQLNSWTYGT